MVMVGKPKSAQTPRPDLSRGPFCAMFRAEREYDNENLPRAPEGSSFAWLLALGAAVSYTHLTLPTICSV
eukprot:10404476-Alexandrium_andersonii.AAC.1